MMPAVVQRLEALDADVAQPPAPITTAQLPGYRMAAAFLTA